MMNPEDLTQDLARDVVADVASAAFREETLRQTLDQARRRRQRRRHARLAALGMMPVLIVAAVLVLLASPDQRATTAPEAAETVASGPRMVAGTGIRELSDDDLLALFPDRPVAMIGRGTHRQLVFLDEVRGEGL